MIAQFNALLIMALHHGRQDPTIAQFIRGLIKANANFARIKLILAHLSP